LKKAHEGTALPSSTDKKEIEEKITGLLYWMALVLENAIASPPLSAPMIPA